MVKFLYTSKCWLLLMGDAENDLHRDAITYISCACRKFVITCSAAKWYWWWVHSFPQWPSRFVSVGRRQSSFQGGRENPRNCLQNYELLPLICLFLTEDLSLRLVPDRATCVHALISPIAPPQSFPTKLILILVTIFPCICQFFQLPSLNFQNLHPHYCFLFCYVMNFDSFLHYHNYQVWSFVFTSMVSLSNRWVL